MMRKLFFGLLTALTLAACSSDPVYHGMSPQQKEDYSKAVAGEYTGTYIIIYNDGRSDAKASSSLLSKASTKGTPCCRLSTTGRTTRQSI